MKPQAHRVLDILQDGKEHATCEIFERTMITRVPARILELKRDGHDIVTGRVKVHGTWWASYRLVIEKQGRLSV